ncbi:sensor histidine kinase [Streptomyces sp. NBC_01022]|uniref:sensor histidine kinase n=1 Tax=Streptomyces sp. NBC_01022 TaxID=2903723 RepID=UPI002DD9D6AD|nr:HAMP domain-containing sensor histidine kinase [Streptomyces sp. NBC_01022]WRZ85615.1 HAMP domain-containing histidine kinase [Streptomyces sp. NBC_01022]
MRIFRHGPGPRTLRGRLALVAVTAAALLVLALTVAFNGLVRRQLQQQANDHLHTRAAAVAATVDTTGAPAHVVEVPHDDLLDADVWIYAGSERIEAPPSAVEGPLTLAARGGSRCVTLDGEDPIRLCTQPVPGPGPSPAAVVTALALAPYRSLAQTALYASLALDATIIACIYVLTRLAVGRALRPVQAMTDQATRWSVPAADGRFGHSNRPTELARLGTSLDALLDRIRAGLRHEQQLTRELSHELRNPLARIIAELDWWRSRPRSAAESELACAAIADAAQSMRTICDTLLDDARGAADALPGSAEILPALLRLVDRCSAPRKVEVAVMDRGLAAGVPAALLERTVSPLLDNALRYAHSRVRVMARGEEGSVLIEVTDDGPGVPLSFAPDLFRPGRRADPGDGHGGAGLGLPLARRLARSADGDVRHDQQHGRGARFVVTLPAG